MNQNGSNNRRGNPNASARAKSTAQRQQNGEPQTQKKKKKSNSKSVWTAILKFVVCMCCVGLILLSVLAVVVSLYVVEATADDDTLLDLNNMKLNFTSSIYVKNSQTSEWYEYQKLIGNEHRIWVNSADIPDNLKNAFIAIEDKNFMTHSGFSVQRTVLAGLNEVAYKLTGHYLTGRQLGASTINQQLIKKLTGDASDESGMEGYKRKIREIFRAIALDSKYSKEIILEAYLNRIEFTGNTAGVAAEANKLFNKDVSDLELWECASLASIVKAPTTYNPRLNPDKHLERRNQVLWEMWDQGYIDEEAYLYAKEQPIGLYEKEVDEDALVTKTSNNSYFTDAVIEEVVSQFVEQKGYTRQEATALIYNGGLSIYTTMVPEVQEAMEEVMFLHEMYPETYSNGKTIEHEYEEIVYNDDGTVKKDADGNTVKETLTETPQSAMAVVNYEGEVCGVVGGLGEKTEDRGLNRATQSKRQIGSTMKPIGVYALGIQNNYIHYSYAIPDAPIVIDDEEAKTESLSYDGVTVIPAGKREWPKNYSNTYTNAPMLICDAIANSINTVAVKVLQFVGERNSFDFVHDNLQISSLVKSRDFTGADGVTRVATDIGLSQMGLGSLTDGITPLEMAGAYMIFGNGGSFTTLHTFTSVENTNGEIILEPILTTTQAISEDTAMIMNKMLEGVLTYGTGHGLGVPGEMASVGKTGTTSDDKDHWFVGLTPYYVTATWWGFDHPTDGINFHQYRQHPPTLAWRAVMEKCQEGLEYKAFPVSDNVQKISYCKDSGALAGPGCPNVGTGYYKTDYTPDATCILHPVA
ncbi:MAG: transglycosylase domain-containing protein [Oscillospiraceae bacterium]|nr:transglycosylase domain-containing protein [Oscillospiraceae bacterium]